MFDIWAQYVEGVMIVNFNVSVRQRHYDVEKVRLETRGVLVAIREGEDGVGAGEAEGVDDVHAIAVGVTTVLVFKGGFEESGDGASPSVLQVRKPAFESIETFDIVFPLKTPAVGRRHQHDPLLRDRFGEKDVDRRLGVFIMWVLGRELRILQESNGSCTTYTRRMLRPELLELGRVNK